MKRLSFNKDWTFEKRDKDSQLKSFQGQSNKIKVTLPYDAMIREKRSADCPSGAQSGFYPGGEYIYEKEFFVPNEWMGQDVCLEFEGVYGNSGIWMNGAKVKTNRNGYVGFMINLNPWMICGQTNVIRLEVDNTMQPNSRWYTGSGIYRNVNLLIGEGVYVSGDQLRITTLALDDDVAMIEVCAALKNTLGHGLEADCIIEIRDAGGDFVIAKEMQNVVFREKKTETVRVRIPVKTPQTWSAEHPYLYECHITTKAAGEVCDEIDQTFGIRMLSLDPVKGFRVNGETVKLRGACIHHDNGIIGAETFAQAEWYRCRRLKEAGFNAIRSAHHPMSKAMLDACDYLGMYVMDELSDVWIRHKNQYDDADIFSEAGQWIEAIVSKDYNHPSVVLYCVGNEILEAGTKQGSLINRSLCNYFHELDSTRYTTNALNALNCAGKRLKPIMKEIMEKFGTGESGGGSGGGSNALNSFMSLMTGERGDYFAKHPLVGEALDECTQSCDVAGFNYLAGRYLLEHELHPNKTVLGTETYPNDIEELWRLVIENPHVIGDFTWAGYDYIGEAGVGIFHYDGKENFTSIFPERLGYIGDIDLIGNRRPISYYREIIYGLTDTPYIAVERMEHTGQKSSRTAWMFKDNIASWTWRGYEDIEAAVDVYSAADEVELFINGASLGRKKAGCRHHFMAQYRIPYKPGELVAVAYNDGVSVGERRLQTAGKAAALKAERVTEDGGELAYVKVHFADEQDRLNPQEKITIHVKVSGNGTLEGFGTANPSSEEDYFADRVTAYDGYAMAAVRMLNPESEEPAFVRFSAEGCQDIEVQIGGKKYERD